MTPLKLSRIYLVILLASACSQQPKVDAVASIAEIHEAMINPASDAIFNVGSEPPKDDQAWTAVRNNAIILAESGNLLMIGSRAKDGGDWMKMSQAMAAAAVMALKAANAKQADALIEAGAQLVAACETCHQPYRDGGRQMGAPRP